ncbi:MAG: fibronectin type III domain-containing protein [Cytophagales bacterium]|nr:MAG: fibronectin type III domain-containing protein [Cytophagales bacterium]
MLLRSTLFLWLIVSVLTSYAQSGCSPATSYLTNTNHESATFYVYLNSGASRALIQWRAVNDPTWSVPASLSSTGSYDVRNLINNSNYEWRTRTVCSAGDTSGYSAAQSFQTACRAPTYPQVYTGLYNGASINWNTNAQPFITHEIQYRLANFTNWSSTTVVNPSMPYALTGLQTDALYEWRVRAVCSATATSTFLDGPIFRTVCNPPTNLYTYDVYHNRATINWSTSQPYVQTELQWRAVTSASWNSLTFTGVSSTVLTGLANNTRYEWRVRTVCSPQVMTDFSTPQTFLTQCSLPENLQVNNTNATSAAIYFWSRNPGASYVFQWKAVSESNWNTINNLPVSSSFRLTNLAVNTSYNWRVQAVCSSTESSAFANGTTFFTLCNTPGPWSLASTPVTSTSALISWPNDEPDVRYTVRWRQQGATDWSSLANITRTSTPLTNLTPQQTYEWQVQRVCSLTSTGASSMFSTLQTFQTNCPTVSDAYYPSVRSDGAIVNWAGFGSSFDVQWRRRGTTDWATAENIASKEYQITGLPTDSTYEWRVRTNCGNGLTSSYNSQGPQFTTRCSPSPSSWANPLSVSSVRIAWGTGGNGRYNVYWRQSGQATWTRVGDLSQNSLLLENLPPGFTYQYYVEAQCANGVVTPNPAVNTFSLVCQEPYVANAQLITPTSAELSWATTVAPTYTVRYRELFSPNWQEQSGVAESYLQLTNLRLGAQYEWQVQANCTAQVGSAYKQGTVFRANCPMPTDLFGYQSWSSEGFTVSWQTPPLDGISFTVQWRETGTTAWTSSGTILQRSFQLPDIRPQTNYEWRVLANCPYADTPAPVESAISSFSSGQTNSCPTLSVHVDEPNGAIRQLRWRLHDYPNVRSVEVTVTPLPLSGLPNMTTVVSGITTNAYSLTNLTLGQRYEYQVRAECVLGEYSRPWREEVTPGCPVVSSVYAQEIQSTQVTIYLGGTSFVGEREIQYREAGTTAWNVVINTGRNFQLLQNLQPGRSYECQVRVLCATGEYITSQLTTFSTPLGCSDIAYDVGSRGSNTSVQLNWSGTSPSYTVWWRQTNETVWQRQTGVTSTSLLLSNLQSGATYSWRAIPSCSPAATDNSPNASLNLYQFTTQCPQIWNTSVNSGRVRANSALVDIEFHTGRSGAAVEMQWREVGTLAWRSQVVLTPPYELTGLPEGRAIEHRVRAVCSDGTVSAFVTSSSWFTTGCPQAQDMVIVSVIPGYTSANVFWSNRNGLATVPLELQWRKAPGQPGGTELWTTVGSVPTNPYALTNLSPNTRYEWRVRALCSAESSSPYSGVLAFKTECTPVYALSAVNITPTSARIVWEGAANSTYEMQYRSALSPDWLTQTTSQTAISLTGLLPSVTYIYRVRQQCGPDMSQQAYSRSFQTICPAPNANSNYVYINGTGPNSLTLSWPLQDGLQRSVRYRPLGSLAWTQTDPSTVTPLVVAGLTGNTLYEVETQSVCEMDARSTFMSMGWPGVRTAPEPSAVYTVQHGSWADGRTWSTNRPPRATDPVRVRHLVQVPSRFTGVTGPMQLEVGGQLRFETEAGLKTGN